MRISEFLTQAMIVPELQALDKESVLREMADHLCTRAASMTVPAERVVRALLDRERLGSTGVGEGVAIPHAKISGLTSLVACFGRSPRGVTFDAIDNQPVNLIFVLLVPENSAGMHLKALARISRLLKSASFRQLLLTTVGREPLYQAFLAEDSKY